MFKEFEIAYHWDEEYYDELQNKIGGCVQLLFAFGFRVCMYVDVEPLTRSTHYPYNRRGIPKMRFYFGERGWPTSTLGPAPAEQGAREAMLNTLQDRKTDIYKEMIRGGTAAVRCVFDFGVWVFWVGPPMDDPLVTLTNQTTPPPTRHHQVRPGVLRLIEEARGLGEARPKLAICSASTKTSCLFVLDNLLGPSVLQHFDLILAGDDVQKRKPDPEIYRLASQRYVYGLRVRMGCVGAGLG